MPLIRMSLTHCTLTSTGGVFRTMRACSATNVSSAVSPLLSTYCHTAAGSAPLDATEADPLKAPDAPSAASETDVVLLAAAEKAPVPPVAPRLAVPTVEASPLKAPELPSAASSAVVSG